MHGKAYCIDRQVKTGTTADMNPWMKPLGTMAAARSGVKFLENGIQLGSTWRIGSKDHFLNFSPGSTRHAPICVNHLDPVTRIVKNLVTIAQDFEGNVDVSIKYDPSCDPWVNQERVYRQPRAGNGVLRIVGGWLLGVNQDDELLLDFQRQCCASDSPDWNTDLSRSSGVFAYRSDHTVLKGPLLDERYQLDDTCTTSSCAARGWFKVMHTVLSSHDTLSCLARAPQ